MQPNTAARESSSSSPVNSWSIQDVLYWLRYTSSGMFEEYVGIFEENHIGGQALLSLDNDILKEEFGIKSYGKRFELLQAIQKLKKMSTKNNSFGKDSNKSTSQTYYVGMNRSNSNDKVAMHTKDNWENLNILHNAKMMDQSQLLKVVNNVVNEVTGTEISARTREKHSFYRKLSNLSMHQQKSVHNKDLNDGSCTVPKTTTHGGGFEFDINIPDWDDISIKKAIQYEWDHVLKKWIKKNIFVKIAQLPFGRGALRLSYYCLNLGESIEGQSGTPLQSKNMNNQNNRRRCKSTNQSTKSATTRNKSTDLISKLLNNQQSFGGSLCVAKKCIGLIASIESYFYDVRTQCESEKFAHEYNKHNPPKKVAFLRASVIEIVDDISDSDNGEDDWRFFCMEQYLHGSYVKHIDNHGGDEMKRNTPSAFAHFTYEASDHRLLVCDIQGVGDLYTDPQIHTYHGRGYGVGNLGIDGIFKFLQTHECNAICKHFKFNSTKNAESVNSWIFGTRPDQLYMKQKQINIIDTEYIDNDKYLEQIPELNFKKLKQKQFLAQIPNKRSNNNNLQRIVNSQTNININFHPNLANPSINEKSLLLQKSKGNGKHVCNKKSKNTQNGKSNNGMEGDKCCSTCTCVIV